MLRVLRLAGVLGAALLASACLPLSAASMIGSTVVKTISNYNEAESREAPERSAIAKANLDLGVEYMQRGEYEVALERFNRAIEADRNFSATYSMLGLLYQRLGEDKLAEENFKHAIKLDDSAPAYFNNYGQFLCKQDRTGEAEQNFLKAAGNPLNGAPELAYSNAGTCAFMHKDIAKATEYFKKALSEEPRMPVALLGMSEIKYNHADYQAADGYLHRYLQVAKHNPRSLWLGIRIKNQLGDADAQASYALQLRNLFPDSEEAALLNGLLPTQQALARTDQPERLPPLLNDFGIFGAPDLLQETQLLSE